MKNPKHLKKTKNTYISQNDIDIESSDEEDEIKYFMETNEDDEKCFTITNFKWFLNSGCSNHMNEVKYLFSSMSPNFFFL